jgi:hypothetical protein
MKKCLIGLYNNYKNAFNAFLLCHKKTNSVIFINAKYWFFVLSS